jgi:hypothetical protein
VGCGGVAAATGVTGGGGSRPGPRAVGSAELVGAVAGGGVEVVSVPQAIASNKITSDRNPPPNLRVILTAECSDGVPERQTRWA